MSSASFGSSARSSTEFAFCWMTSDSRRKMLISQELSQTGLLPPAVVYADPCAERKHRRPSDGSAAPLRADRGDLGGVARPPRRQVAPVQWDGRQPRNPLPGGAAGEPGLCAKPVGPDRRLPP